MTKLGKLTKLKSAMRRWPSLSKLGRNSCTVPTTTTTRENEEEGGDLVMGDHLRREGDRARSVYVGKSRRRYTVSPSVFGHPIFQELLEKSSSWEGYDGGDRRLVVACEVVLFEHLVWMLENEDDDDDVQLGSMDELVGFYTC